MQCEVLSVEVDGLSRQQLHRRSAAPRPFAGRVFAGSTPQTSTSWRILATDADAEQEPAGRQGSEVGDLPGDGDRVAQGEQVHGGVRRHPLGDRKDPGRAEQSVEPGADDEADVVADAEVVEAALLGALDQDAPLLGLDHGHAEDDAADSRTALTIASRQRGRARCWH